EDSGYWKSRPQWGHWMVGTVVTGAIRQESLAAKLDCRTGPGGPASGQDVGGRDAGDADGERPRDAPYENPLMTCHKGGYSSCRPAPGLRRFFRDRARPLTGRRAIVPGWTAAMFPSPRAVVPAFDPTTSRFVLYPLVNGLG